VAPKRTRKRRGPPTDWAEVRAKCRRAFRDAFGHPWTAAKARELSYKSLLDASRQATEPLRVLRKAARRADRVLRIFASAFRRMMPKSSCSLSTTL
jgi:hypothetical protein